jgi:hypothetical protein
VTRKPDAAEHVDFEKTNPVFIRNLFERLWLENTEIVDENVDFSQMANQRPAAVAATEISGDTIDGRVGQFTSYPLHRIADSRLRPAIQGHMGALVC